MSHTKPYIRKKAVLIMYKVFLKYPESLRPAFPRLKEKLEDPDSGQLLSQNMLMIGAYLIAQFSKVIHDDSSFWCRVQLFSGSFSLWNIH